MNFPKRWLAYNSSGVSVNCRFYFSELELVVSKGASSISACSNFFLFMLASRRQKKTYVSVGDEKRGYRIVYKQSFSLRRQIYTAPYEQVE